MKQNDLTFIQSQIGYEFNNPNLLQQAFTRRSYSEENGGENNEVLEFIGDKVLDLLVVKLLITKNSNSEGLFKKFDPKLKGTWSYLREENSFPEENVLVSNHSESELTEIKKLMVQKKTLASRIDDLGLAEYLLMGRGDILQNTGKENSVKEDLFEAILGAVAIDCNWDMGLMQRATQKMLLPESILSPDSHISLINEFTRIRYSKSPEYVFEARGYDPILCSLFNGIIQKVNIFDGSTHFSQTCILHITDALPQFMGFGNTENEALENVCKTAYEYLCQKDLWLSIRDEIDDPNKDYAINQLEILARRGYFSIPTYDFEQSYDKDGNPIWNSICRISEKSKSFSAESSSKKDAKKSAAYKMLQHVLGN